MGMERLQLIRPSPRAPPSLFLRAPETPRSRLSCRRVPRTEACSGRTSPGPTEHLGTWREGRMLGDCSDNGRFLSHLLRRTARPNVEHLTAGPQMLHFQNGGVRLKAKLCDERGCQDLNRLANADISLAITTTNDHAKTIVLDELANSYLLGFAQMWNKPLCTCTIVWISGLRTNFHGSSRYFFRPDSTGLEVCKQVVWNRKRSAFRSWRKADHATGQSWRLDRQTRRSTLFSPCKEAVPRLTEVLQ